MQEFISAVYDWHVDRLTYALKGVFRCAPLSDTCSIDWTAWATFAAVAVLVVAWITSTNSFKGAVRLRNSEWKRAGRLERAKKDVEGRERARATALQAKHVADETYLAISELRAIQSVLREMTEENASGSRAVLGVPLRSEVFYVTERMIHRLHGFSDADQASILHVVRTWKTIPFFSEGAPSEIPVEFFLSRKVNIDANLEAVISNFNELREKLRPYVESIPGVSVITLQDVKASASARRDEVRKFHRVLFTDEGTQCPNPDFSEPQPNIGTHM